MHWSDDLTDEQMDHPFYKSAVIQDRIWRSLDGLIAKWPQLALYRLTLPQGSHDHAVRTFEGETSGDPRRQISAAVYGRKAIMLTSLASLHYMLSDCLVWPAETQFQQTCRKEAAIEISGLIQDCQSGIGLLDECLQNE